MAMLNFFSNSFNAVAMSDKNSIPTILCVDDEHAVLSSLRRVFHRKDYRIVTALSGTEALTILESQPVDVMITDMRMSHMQGDELLTLVVERWPEMKRILLTGYSDHKAIESVEKNADLFCKLEKPWDDGQLQQLVARAIDERQATRVLSS